MSYQAFKVQELDQGTIIKVSISRPKALNAMNPAFFKQLELIFKGINEKENARVAILVGQGRVFTAGLDLKEYGSLFSYDPQEDTARVSRKLYDQLIQMQRVFLSVIECRVPVLVGIHGKCIGGGIDLISMCDIRYCTADTQFTIKEIDIGMAADLGTLQFMPNIIGNESTFRQLAYTGRFFKADQAKDFGFVTKVLQTKKDLDDELLLTAKAIASKSPVGIYTLKQVMKREQYKKAFEGLDYMARINSSMLMTKDTVEAVTSFMQKRKPEFGKL